MALELLLKVTMEEMLTHLKMEVVEVAGLVMLELMLVEICKVVVLAVLVLFLL